MVQRGDLIWTVSKGTSIWRDNILLSQAEKAGKANELSGMSMPSPLLPCQLTSQISGKYKVAPGLFDFVQASRLRSILMSAELHKQCSLKLNPLSSLPKTLTLFSHNNLVLEQQPTATLVACRQPGSTHHCLGSHSTTFTHGFTKRWLNACNCRSYIWSDSRIQPPGQERLMPKGKILATINWLSALNLKDLGPLNALHRELKISQTPLIMLKAKRHFK